MQELKKNWWIGITDEDIEAWITAGMLDRVAFDFWYNLEVEPDSTRFYELCEAFDMDESDQEYIHATIDEIKERAAELAGRPSCRENRWFPSLTAHDVRWLTYGVVC